MLRFIKIFILLLISINSSAIDFKIGLLRNVNIKSVIVTASESSFKLMEGMNELFQLKEGEQIKVSVSNNKIKLNFKGNLVGVYDTLKLLKVSNDTTIFSVKGDVPTFKKNKLPDFLKNIPITVPGSRFIK